MTRALSLAARIQTLLEAVTALQVYEGFEDFEYYFLTLADDSVVELSEELKSLLEGYESA